MSDKCTELVGALDVGVLGRHVLMVPERAPLSASRGNSIIHCDVKAHLETSVDHTRQTQTQFKHVHCKNTQSLDTTGSMKQMSEQDEQQSKIHM